MRTLIAYALAAIVLLAVAPQALRADERVDITATDGVQLIGHLAGNEGPGIVFAHMYPSDQRSWTAFAHEMAQAGFRTLTFDFRGYGESSGTKDVAAIHRETEGPSRHIKRAKNRPGSPVGPR